MPCDLHINLEWFDIIEIWHAYRNRQRGTVAVGAWMFIAGEMFLQLKKAELWLCLF